MSQLSSCQLSWSNFVLGSCPAKSASWYVQPSKTQISLRIRAAWSESSLGALYFLCVLGGKLRLWSDCSHANLYCILDTRSQGYKTVFMLNSNEHEFILPKRVKMSTSVAILTLISRINTTAQGFEARKIFIFNIFVTRGCVWIFMLSWVEHENSFITSDPALCSIKSRLDH